MGSAVDRTNLTRELTRYHNAGLGGVHIIPIYGAKGWEDKYLSYLSPQWMEMLDHTVSEAQRLDLGVDMTTGTGWCFGGKNVTDEEANAAVVSRNFDVAPGEKLKEKFDRKTVQALVAFSREGKCVDLTKSISSSGEVDFSPRAGAWRVYAISQRPSGQKVKRPAAGGEGHMLNLIYPNAVSHFLQDFTEAFRGYTGSKPRAQYHDSYEYRSDWSPYFFTQFRKYRGYRLQAELPALFADADRSRRRGQTAPTNSVLSSPVWPVADADRVARVKSDYRETVSDIMVEESLPLWVKWSHQRDFLTRNEAHGSPGNWLDLYAVADVPETEMFRTDRNRLIAKFASSAAHVTGRKYTSAETATWLKEHFTETLADVKYLFDDMFLSGVNHIFYHGTCYSPDEAGWPGWVFYASTEMNPRNPIWHDAPAINAYAARCQSVLQSGSPDNDVLLYWPIYDFWHAPTGMVQHIRIHGPDWFDEQPISKAAGELWNRGFGFDYVSDRQLAGAKVEQGRVEMPGGNYRAVVVPTCEHMPVATFEKLLSLARSGATVILQERLPKDVPGWADLEKRRGQFRKLRERVTLSDAGAGRLKEGQMGKGRVVVGNIEAALARAGVAREPMVDHPGLCFIRRSFDEGNHYFIGNRGDRRFDGWVRLACSVESVVMMDAMNGRSGVAGSQRDSDGRSRVYLQLEPGESVILRVFSRRKVDGPVWKHWSVAGQPMDVTGEWNVKFIEGGPEMPPEFHTARLASWTELGGEVAEKFAGTARYSIRFDAPDSSRAQNAESRTYSLDLGRVCQSARVRLNGRNFGTLLTPPFRVFADNVKPQGNVLEVEVTSVAANRIRDLDRRGGKWKNFHDINFVNQNYRPFDASDWPLYDCGLLGPVTLSSVSPVAEAKP
jgi:hypothetical protein